MQPKLKVEYVSVDTLAPYAHNAKQHGETDVKAIAASIEQFGFDDPIGVWTNPQGVTEIVEGHGRLLAAKQLGMDKVPIIKLDHLDDEARRAYVHVHNQTTLNTGFDIDMLNNEMANLSEFDWDAFGFDWSDFNDDAGDYEIQEVDTPDDVQARVKLGQIWRLGEHRLMCGDATRLADVTNLIDGGKVVIALTDPPYGISVVQGNKVGGDKQFGKVGGGKIVESKTYSTIIGDETTDTARNNYQVIKNCSENQIIFGGNYFTDFLPPSRCWIVWDKQNTGNFADAELAWTSFDKSVKLYQFMWNGLIRAGDRNIEGATRMHPTQKPVGMLALILKDFSNELDTVLDCFGGSGSTLLACEQLNRKCYMMELDPHYCDVIINRWEDFTGKKAVLESS